MAQVHEAVRHEKLFSQAGIEDPEIRQMAEAIEYFRKIGVERYISLPQLVVIGNQSSGKSSLLRSLTHLPFPTGTGTCTRFAVEVVLKRDNGTAVRTSILPAAKSSDRERSRMEEYGGSVPESEFNAEKFQQVFSEVSKFLKLPPPNFQQSLEESKIFSTEPQPASRFSEHKLRIEASSNTLLSFIDTPGLIQVAANTNTTNTNDRGTILRLVEGLIKDKRTIIVVVMDSRQDAMNQEAFTLSKSVDPSGKRTVGVLTKCDQLQMPEERKLVKKLINNKIIPLDNGWFVVQSCPKHGDSEALMDLTSIHAEEESLFKEEMWNDIEPNRRGSPALRQALGKLFAKQLREEFPKIVEELRDMNNRAIKSLNNLGPPRSTAEEQRNCLLQIAARYEWVMKDNLDGTYIDPTREPAQILQQRRVHESELLSNITFNGTTHKFLSTEQQKDSQNIRFASRIFKTYVQEYRTQKSRDEYVRIMNIYEWINKNCHVHAVPSPCGLIPQSFVDGLFKSLVKPWSEYAHRFIIQLGDNMDQVIKFVAKESTQITSIGEKLAQHLCSNLQKDIKQAVATADDILNREYLKLDTCDVTLLQNLQVKKAKRLVSAMIPLLSTNNSGSGYSVQFLQNQIPNMASAFEQPRDTVYEVHDILESYYNYAFKRYFDNLSRIGADMFNAKNGPLTRFCPSYVKALPDEQLHSICAEDPLVTIERSSLRQRIKKLDDALAYAEQMSREGVSHLMNRPIGALELNGTGTSARNQTPTIPHVSVFSTSESQPQTVEGASSSNQGSKKQNSVFSFGNEKLGTDMNTAGNSFVFRGDGTPGGNGRDTRSKSPSLRPRTPDGYRFSRTVVTPPPSDQKPAQLFGSINQSTFPAQSLFGKTSENGERALGNAMSAASKSPPASDQMPKGTLFPETEPSLPDMTPSSSGQKT